MLTNYHTHTNYCDGKNTPEEVVASAIERGFDAIGFSGHVYVPKSDYGIDDISGYTHEITRLKQKYSSKIQIYLGMEEDALALVNRSDFDYIIGSSHFFLVNGKLYPIDSSPECFKKCLEVFGGDCLKLADTYYRDFCSYIKSRKPDIVGHFDLITKFDELDAPIFFGNHEYSALSQKYMLDALSNDVIFEVNTGAISRGIRTSPYPYADLLHTIKNCGGKVTLSSDSHSVDTVDFWFDEARKMLKDIGFEYTYVLYDNEFKKDYLK